MRGGRFEDLASWRDPEWGTGETMLLYVVEESPS